MSFSSGKETGMTLFNAPLDSLFTQLGTLGLQTTVQTNEQNTL
jgi:hypothetical protein